MVASFISTWHLGQQWFWVPAIPALFGLVVLFARHYRLAILAGTCTLMIVLVIIFWIRGYCGMDQVVFSFSEYADYSLSCKAVGVGSADGGLTLNCSTNLVVVDETRGPWQLGASKRDLIFQWSWMMGSEYVNYPYYNRPAVFQGGGFQFVWFNSGWKPLLNVGKGIGGDVAVAFPNWLTILLLSIAPGCWLYRGHWGRRRFRRRNNLCEKCGYALRGLPKPVRCPECGANPRIPIPAISHGGVQ